MGVVFEVNKLFFYSFYFAAKHLGNILHLFIYLISLEEICAACGNLKGKHEKKKKKTVVELNDQKR